MLQRSVGNAERARWLELALTWRKVQHCQRIAVPSRTHNHHPVPGIPVKHTREAQIEVFPCTHSACSILKINGFADSLHRTNASFYRKLVFQAERDGLGTHRAKVRAHWGNCMPSWFLTQVKSNAGQIAKSNLERQNFQTFQPLGRGARMRRGHCTNTVRPSFPGNLVLIHPKPVAPWSLVSSTYGVARRVSFGGQSAHVPRHIIAELQAACGADGVLMIDHQPQAGAKVAIASGPLAAFVGEVERFTPNRRVQVLLAFMGQRTRVTLPARGQRPADSPDTHVGARR